MKNAIRTAVNRLWLKSLVATDPDVAYFRTQHNSLTREQMRMLQDLALVCDYKATSDIPQWLNTRECEELCAFLEGRPETKRKGRYTFMLDERVVNFSPAASLPDLPRGLDVLASVVMGWLGNQGWALKLFNELGKRMLQKVLRDLKS